MATDSSILCSVLINDYEYSPNKYLWHLAQTHDIQTLS